MRKEPVLTGITLIVLGLALYALVNMRVDESVVLVGIGGAFIAAYVYRRQYGYLVPGCILLGLGIGSLGFGPMAPYVDEPQVFGLGLGFLAIYLIDRLHTRQGSWWPLVPGLVLVFVGLAENSRLLEWFFERGWPLAIVAVGIALLVGGLLGRVGKSS